MRKSLLVGFGLLIATTILLAQEHRNTTEKTVKADISVASDFKVGDKLLRAGEYRIACDRETITFTEATNRDRDARSFKFPCKGKELAAPSDKTEINTQTDAAGVQVVQTLLLKGSNVAHVFN
jgi:hypothetical protein